jgi:transposase-like protein
MPAQVAGLLTEIIELVVDYLTVDIDKRIQNVREACLISRAWVEPAQRWLFSHISIPLEYSSLYQSRNPLRFYASHINIAHYVRSIRVITSSRSERIDPAILDVVCSTFPNLVNCDFTAQSGMYGHVLAVLLPGWIRIESLRFLYGLPFLFNIGLRGATGVNAISSVRLTSLDIRTWCVTVMVDLLSSLEQTSTRETLRSACLMYLPTGGSNPNDDAVQFAASIRALNAFNGLQKLKLLLMPIKTQWITNVIQYKGTYTFLTYHLTHYHPSDYLIDTSSNIYSSMITDFPALTLAAVTSMKITVHCTGVDTNALLRGLLLQAAYPNLRALTIYFINLFNEPIDPDGLGAFDPAKHVTAFRPFSVLHVPSGLPADTTATLAESHQIPIVRAEAMRRLDALWIVIRASPSVRKVLVHDTTAFLQLFGLSRADATSAVSAEPSECAIEFLD